MPSEDLKKYLSLQGNNGLSQSDMASAVASAIDGGLDSVGLTGALRFLDGNGILQGGLRYKDGSLQFNVDGVNWKDLALEPGLS